tara:strand:+ start:283 stop:522 length:240 start_codon:yes stop_codon:yes gene_type:complete
VKRKERKTQKEKRERERDREREVFLGGVFRDSLSVFIWGFKNGLFPFFFFFFFFCVSFHPRLFISHKGTTSSSLSSERE